MFEALLVVCVGIFGMTTARIEHEAAVLKRLDATERLVRELLNEVDNMKSQDRLQKSQIAQMENQLLIQQQRSSQLEVLIRRLKVSDRRKSSIKNKRTERKHRRSTENGLSDNRRAENETPVAFFAKMVNHLEHGTVHQTVIFDEVVTNIGSAYNKDLGEFVAPVPGIYVFSTTLVSRHFNAAHAQFVKNGTALTTMYVDSGQTGDDTTSQTIVLQLQKGEEVSVQNLDSDTAFFGASHSIFSGFLLQEYYANTAIVGK